MHPSITDLYIHNSSFLHIRFYLSLWNLLNCTQLMTALQNTLLPLPIYSGRMLTRFGRANDWSFLISDAVTLQDSKVNDRKFFRGFKYCKPSLVTREFDTLNDTNVVNPAAFSDDISAGMTKNVKRILTRMLKATEISYAFN